MSTTVSIVTALYPPASGFVEAARDSVEGLEVPPGWQVEWLVQEDGPEPSWERRLARSPRVRYECNGARLGVSTTRNLALRRARGSLVQVLDHDDLLLPSALSAVVPAFDSPAVHWATGQADDLLPDGSRRAFPPDLPAGLVPPGALNAFWAREGRFPVHCAGLMLRTETLRAFGGWIATPRSEDVATLAGISELYAGVLFPEVTWLYRQWPGQTRREPQWLSRGNQGMEIVAQRVSAIRSLTRSRRSEDAEPPRDEY